MKKPKKPRRTYVVRWVNVYPCPTAWASRCDYFVTNAITSRALADESAQCGRIACVRIRIPVAGRGKKRGKA